MSDKPTGLLLEIAKQNGGVLLPQDVVNAARPATSPLHQFFEWNNGRAAEKWRLHEARNLIRVVVDVLEVNGVMTNVRAFYSLMPDRSAEGGGYRITVDILAKPEQREQLLSDALDELTVFQDKYAMLSELAQVFAAADRVRKPRKQA
jgi:hypothetical protein